MPIVYKCDMYYHPQANVFRKVGSDHRRNALLNIYATLIPPTRFEVTVLLTDVTLIHQVVIFALFVSLRLEPNRG